MKIAGRKNSTFWEWTVLFGSMAATIAAVKAIGVSQKWEAPAVYTVIIFVVVVISLRPAWGRANFWRALIVIFLIHTLGIYFAIREFPILNAGFHGMLLTLAAVVEGLVIASFLWRASIKKPAQRPS